eukprot:scaffold993_cov110-Cylindrotheca_fusiformis.AAC.20
MSVDVPVGKPIAAIAQLRSTSNKLENLAAVAKCARMAKEKGAKMLFLPECFGFMGESSDQTLEEADDPSSLDDSAASDNSETVTKLLQLACSEKISDFSQSIDSRISVLGGLRTIARETRLWISGGGFHVGKAPPDDQTGHPRVYNTHVILDDNGNVQAVYRKVHLFDVSIPGKVELRESKTTAPGTDLVVCDSPIGKLGLSTCYDVRFPEMYLSLVNHGAQILLVPSAFTVPTGTAHWHTLLRARAIESQCYVLAAAQVGKHNSKRESFGHSLAVDPWGKILADAGGALDDAKAGEEPSIISCEIDLELIDSIRQRMPIGMHRDNSSFSPL